MKKEIHQSVSNSSKEDIKTIDEKDIKTGAVLLKLAGWTNNEILSKLNRYEDVLEGIEKL